MTAADDLLVARSIECAGIDTVYVDVGAGPPVVLLHGSGPGVNALANWQATLQGLSGDYRVLAPDMVGYGETARPAGTIYGVSTWVRHVMSFLDRMDLGTVHLIGNSMGGLVALHIAQLHPERVGKLVLMGTPGPSFVPGPGLRALRDYSPSLDNMRALLLENFAHDPAIVTDDLVRRRYEMSARPDVRAAYHAMFHDPAHAGNSLELSAAGVRSVQVPTLIVHGKHDKVIPLESGLELVELIPGADGLVFAASGHWPQIERAHDFNTAVRDFLRR